MSKIDKQNDVLVSLVGEFKVLATEFNGHRRSSEERQLTTDNEIRKIEDELKFQRKRIHFLFNKVTALKLFQEITANRKLPGGEDWSFPGGSSEAPDEDA